MSQQINLFDPSMRTRRPLFTAGTIALAIGVVVAGMLGMHDFARKDLAKAEALRDAADTRVIALRAQLASIGSQSRRDSDKALLDEIARVDARVKNWHELLERLRGAGIGNTEGHASFLEALAREQTDGVWLTNIAIGGAAGGFSIKGRVLRPDLLTGYLQSLSREKALRGRAIGDMKIVQQQPDPAAGGQRNASAAPGAPQTSGGPQTPGSPQTSGGPGAQRLPRPPEYVEFSIGTDAPAEAGG